MTTYTTACRECGAEFEPSREAIRAGTWQRCPACSPAPAAPHRCRECHRPLRPTRRAVCARCLGGDR
jgi:DNA-directed RNA polymerase subunit RPC12/RpoP